MSAKQLPGGVIQFSGEIVFRHDDPPAQPTDNERVAILAALSLLAKTELLEKAPPYMLDKLKARLTGFNRRTYTWQNKQKGQQ